MEKLTWLLMHKLWNKCRGLSSTWCTLNSYEMVNLPINNKATAKSKCKDTSTRTWQPGRLSSRESSVRQIYPRRLSVATTHTRLMCSRDHSTLITQLSLKALRTLISIRSLEPSIIIHWTLVKAISNPLEWWMKLVDREAWWRLLKGKLMVIQVWRWSRVKLVRSESLLSVSISFNLSNHLWLYCNKWLSLLYRETHA